MPPLSSKELREKFSALATREDVADILGISWPRLRFHLYRNPLSQRYSSFSIPKKNGGSRKILAPNESLKSIQRKLRVVLEAVYNPKSPVHGFTAGRSILTNASVHTHSRYVLNVDLTDFFPSINLGRVRALFMAKPYSCNSAVATVLAQVCCHDGKLPQGAPTSPIVSNMICSRLDRQMREMAKAYRCSYTRYADDITLSTSLATFPPEIAKLEMVSGRLQCRTGVSLVDVITSNGFVINFDKLRLRTRRDRQEVTGLTTNIFPNVSRRFVRQIRAMLHAWRKYGIDEATREYAEKYLKGHRHPKRRLPDFARVVKGKITYLGMVRGKNDPIYGRFVQEFQRLAPDMVKPDEVYDPFAEIMDNVLILETYEGNEINQGTAFFLREYGFVTCAHVLGTDESSTTAYTRHDRKPHAIGVIARNQELDVALLNIDIDTRGGLRRGDSRRLKVGDEIQLVGFPNHNYGDSGILDRGAIIGRRRVGQADRFLISRNIVFGNSGGPVLDRNDNVVGIAVTGAPTLEESRETEAHGVIPIETLERLVFAR